VTTKETNDALNDLMSDVGRVVPDSPQFSAFSLKMVVEKIVNKAVDRAIDAERATSAELREALRAVIETRAAYDGESSWSLESRWAVYVIARDAAVALLEKLE
jgi:hypothetical protein